MTFITKPAIVAFVSLLLTSTLYAQSFPVRRSTPYKVGDKWRTNIREVKETKGVATVSRKDRKISSRVTTRVKAVITIKDVDKQGFATLWTAQIVEFVRLVGSRRLQLLKPRDVIRFRVRGGELIFTYDNGGRVSEPGNEIRNYLKLPAFADEAPLEPKQSIRLGATWKCDTKTMKDKLIANGPPQAKKFPEVFAIEASGRLGAKIIQATTANRQNCLDLRFRTKTRITKSLEQPQQYLDKAESVTEEQFHMPLDYSRDFQFRKVVQTEEMKTLGKVPQVPSLNVKIVTTTTEQRTYLNFTGGGVRKWKALDVASDVGLLRGLIAGISFDKREVKKSGKTNRLRTFGKAFGDMFLRASGHGKGVAGDSIRFDGKDDFVNVARAREALQSGLDGVTVATWIKTRSKKLQFVFDVGFYASTSLSMTVQDGEGRFVVAGEAGGIPVSFPLAQKGWVHVALVWDGRTQRVYVNGKLETSRFTKKRGRLTKKTIGKQPLLIASQSKKFDRGRRYFQGELDEFAMWGRALTDVEVQTVYRHGKQGISLFQR